MRLDRLTHRFPRVFLIQQRILHFLKFNFLRLFRLESSLESERIFQEKRELIAYKYFSGKNVLDVGCGTGDFLETLRMKYDVVGFGLDFSKGMAEVSFEKGILCVVGDASKLPFRNDTFDAVTFNGVFHHLPEQHHKETVDEAIRVAREVILINDLHLFERPFLKLALLVYYKITDGGFLYRTLQQWEHFLLRDKEIIDSFIGHGFCRKVIFLIKHGKIS